MPTINEFQITQLLRGLEIPPCPAVLAELSMEMRRQPANGERIAALIGRDVALAGGVLKIANSPLFANEKRITSVGEAVSLLGLQRLFNMVINELLRKTLTSSELPLRMDRFWDSAAYNACIAAELARHLPGTDPDTAYSFGLCHDGGVPIMMRRFADYKDTLQQANESVGQSFTACEDGRHGTNHTVIGYLMARNWGLPEPVSQAVLVHHDYSIFANDNHLPDETLALVAINFVAERITGLYLRSAADAEWQRGRALVGSFLGMSEEEMGDLIDDLLFRLDSGAMELRTSNFA